MSNTEFQTQELLATSRNVQDMEFPFAVIEKRDGRKVPFDFSRIESAIGKAFRASQEQTESREESIRSSARKVAERLGVDADTGRYFNPNSQGARPITVEGVQDVVERVLMENGFGDTAKAYILFRAERTRRREMDSKLMATYRTIDKADSKSSNLKRENANIDGDTAMGTMLRYGSEGAKAYNSMFILSAEAAEAHRNGDIHIHDMDFLTLTMTCCQIDLSKLFRGGFGTGHGTIREPGGIRAAASLACIALQANQNDMHGGQSIPLFDYYMAPYVGKTFRKTFLKKLSEWMEHEFGRETANDCSRKFAKTYGNYAIENDPGIKGPKEQRSYKPSLGDNPDREDPECAKVLLSILKSSSAFLAERKLDESALFGKLVRSVKKIRTMTIADTKDATYQAMEALIHNLNTMHSRAGAQVPFSSVNFGTDVSPEGRMVSEQFLKAIDAGLGRHETAIFPVSIFKVKEGINYLSDDPNRDLFELACKVSAKRLFPNFAFIDAPFNLQYYHSDDPNTEIAYMGCRTRVIGNTFDPTREIVTGRGNLSFTSINLPRLAIRATMKHGIASRAAKNSFFDALSSKLDLVEQQLLERFEIQKSKRVLNFPFLMGQGVWIDSDKLDREDKVDTVIRHGSLGVGFIGLAECLTALWGKHHAEDEDAQKLGLEIVAFMRNRVDDMSARNRLNFSLIATPAEGLSGRFTTMDKKLFGSIDGVTDRKYYTNSFHVPVHYMTTFAKKIETEAPYHALTNGGHITYVEYDGDPTINLKAFMKIVDAMKNAGIGYGAINHPLDRDPACGYTGVIGDVCPGCGRTENQPGPNGTVQKFERIRRITGYLVGTLDRFNDAKRAEEHDRVKHSRIAGHLS